MSLARESAARSEVVEILGSIRSKRVRFWSENGELYYRAPKGALSREEIEKLRTLSGSIVAFLEEAAGRSVVVPNIEPRGPAEQVPLTFSQLKYWRRARLAERPAVRSVSAIVRVHGPLDIDLLQRCLVEIVRRHEALRTRIVTIDGVLVQQVAETCDCDLAIHDLKTLSEHDRAAELGRLIDELIHEPIRIDIGPLFGCALMCLREDEHVLSIVMDHIVSDGYSVSVLVRDLSAAYRQGAQGRALSLPGVPIQLADYAVWQSKTHALWLKRHGSYWTKRLAGCGRVKFPRDGNLAHASSRGCAIVPVRIDEQLGAALREWCRVRRTTLVLGVFTAFVALVLRWCDESEAVLRFQSDGRFDPALENSIGYFACVLNLRLQLHEQDSFIDLLERVTQEYCAACEHADLSYVDTRLPQPGFVRNSSFNWVPRASASSSASTSAPDAVTFRPFEFALPTSNQAEYDWDYEPSIVLFDKGEVIEGRLLFCPERHRVATIEAFRNGLLTLIAELLRDAEQPVQSVALPRK